MVNNATYLAYFEVGRVEWLRAASLSYKELEREGYGIIVVEAHVRYRRPAYFDDELTLRTELTELGGASLRFEYAILRGGEVLAAGYTRHACVALATGRPSRMPEQLLAVARRTP